MINVSVVVSTDKQGGVEGTITNESRDITKLEKKMLSDQKRKYLDLLKAQIDAIVGSPPPK
jgi:hypothetical protein